jgi:hypothetical protein
VPYFGESGDNALELSVPPAVSRVPRDGWIKVQEGVLSPAEILAQIVNQPVAKSTHFQLADVVSWVKTWIQKENDNSCPPDVANKRHGHQAQMKADVSRSSKVSSSDKGFPR